MFIMLNIDIIIYMIPLTHDLILTAVEFVPDLCAAYLAKNLVCNLNYQ